MSAPSFALVGLGPIINRWKYFVAGAVALAALVSIVVALLLPNVYRSTAIFIPTNPQTADPDRLLEDNVQIRGKLELSGRAEDLNDTNPDKVGSIRNARGGFIDGVDQFDTEHFGYFPTEAQRATRLAATKPEGRSPKLNSALPCRVYSNSFPAESVLNGGRI